MVSFADALCAAPIGAALLERLEWEQHPKKPWEQPELPNDTYIAQAANHVSAMSLGELLDAAFSAGSDVGPWVQLGDANAFDAYQHVEQRRPIADAIDEVFGDQLNAPIDLDAQEWWVGDAKGLTKHLHRIQAFGDFSMTYGSGEFPGNALRTVTTMPTDVHRDFVGEQEIPDPVGRWLLPVERDRIAALPVATIHRPSDWADLIAEHPLKATPHQAGWSLPNKHPEFRSDHPLFELENQHAVVWSHSRHLVPDWNSVATKYSGVHLSWAGWMTSEGYVHVDNTDTVTMLRYWFSDRTFWLHDVFGEPFRLPDPDINQTTTPNQAEDELAVLLHFLGR